MIILMLVSLYWHYRSRISKAESGNFSLGEIPLVTIYSGKTENLVSKPPLLDIAYLNLAHFQRQADLIHSLHVASQPMLVMEGYDDQTKDLLYL